MVDLCHWPQSRPSRHTTMRLQCDLNRQVRGHRPARAGSLSIAGHRSHSILLSSPSSFVILVLCTLTWSSLIDGVANLNQRSSGAELIDASSGVLAPSRLITTPSDNSTTLVHDKIGKSVPLDLSSPATTSSTSVSTSRTPSDTNYHQPGSDAATDIANGANRGNSSSGSNLAPNADPIHDSHKIAQFKKEAARTTTAQPNDVHDTFLLMCSAHAIRFWSISCPVHSSNFLMSHSRSSSIKYGISSIALWRPQEQWASVELVWYDVSEAQFHRASIQRQHATDCDELLGIEFNQTLDYSSNPFASKFLQEKRVRLAVDSRNQLLFAANYVQQRIDIYRLDSATAANNEMVWLAALDAHYPYDIAVDGDAKTVLWVENRQRLCRLEYHFEDQHFLALNRNLSALKTCSDPLAAAPPQALTLDVIHHKIVWSGKDGELYRDDYQLNNMTNHTELIGRADMADISNLVMSGDDTLYLSDDRDVQVYRLKARKFDFVSVETNTLFGLLVIDNLTMSSVKYQSETTTTAATPLTDQNVTVSVHTSELSTQTIPLQNQPELVPNLPENEPNSASNLTRILLLTLVPLIIILVIMCAICLCCRNSSRIVDLPRKFHINTNARTSRLFSWTQRWARYNQLRKTRASSTGRDQLIDEDVEQPPAGQQTFYGDSNCTVVSEQVPPSSQRTRPPHYYRQNLVRQSSGLDDIEDMFGSGLTHSHRPPNTCIACRDQDICQDKGICMQTYRVL